LSGAEQSYGTRKSLKGVPGKMVVRKFVSSLEMDPNADALFWEDPQTGVRAEKKKESTGSS